MNKEIKDLKSEIVILRDIIKRDKEEIEKLKEVILDLRAEFYEG